MCISNEKAKEILKGIRNIDSLSVDEIAELVANLKVFEEVIEEAQSKAKKILVDKGFDKTLYFSDIEKKIYLSEGKAFTNYDNEAVYKEVGKKTFLEIVKVTKKLVEAQPEAVQKAVDKCSEGGKGKPYITVHKMSKKELIEKSE